jgi:hypothetical protein
MTTAILAANAPIQFSTGAWARIKKETRAEIISQRFGIYKVNINGRVFSVDYKFVTVGGD